MDLDVCEHQKLNKVTRFAIFLLTRNCCELFLRDSKIRAASKLNLMMP